MILKIENKETIGNLRTAFSKHFPFLKLVFYNEKDFPPQPYLKENMVSDQQLLIGDIRKGEQAGWLEIDPDDTAETVEQNFMEGYGVAVQVFRRSGIVWLRTTTTDNLSLTSLNKLGEMMNLSVTEEPEHEADVY